MKTLRKYLYYFGLFLGLSFFSWQLLRTINSNSITLFSSNNPYLLLLVFLVLVITFSIQYFNWKVILEGVNQKLTWLEVSRGYSLSFIARYIPGTIWGYVSRNEWMLRNLRVPYIYSSAASIVEILVTISSAFLMIGLVGLFSPISKIFPSIDYALIIPLIMIFIIKRLELIKEFSIFNRKIPNPIWKIPLRTWIKCNIISIIQWILYGICLWFLIISFSDIAINNEFSLITLLEAIFCFAFAWCIGFLIPFIPGGLGVREMTLTLLLVNVFYLPFEESSLISIVLRIFTFIVELFWMGWGVVFTYIDAIKNK